ncbi:MAG: L-fucose isomerase [Chloroflexi bacterium]|nr:L-fucose isomerase [Chloroflexota bacterium]
MTDFKKNPPRNRLVGDMPKIGIRPTIDGRLGGVRESLEAQTMAMARSVADLLTKNMRHANGLPVECVIADGTIGRVTESAACAEKFRKEGVGLTITVTPCWCYGAETMDMDPLMPKAVWGFNGTERPGAVYLAAVLAAHTQKGLPAFGIYGRDVQNAEDTSIPTDVAERLLQFARAGVAVATMRGKSYLSIGGTSMGIAGSIIDPSFFETYLGMRVENIDMVEVSRRVDEGIYDKEEFETALAWANANLRKGQDYNPPHMQHSPEKKNWAWEYSLKMTMIVRDLMVGNPRLAESGFGEEALGHNAIAAGFQGQRQWTDHYPNGDMMEGLLNTSFDWTGLRQPTIVATENDALNGVGMLFGHLLTGTAQIFSDVRTYWSPEAVKRVTGYELSDRAAGGFLHLINSGPTALDATGQQEIDGQPVIKPFWEITPAEAQRCLDVTTWHTSVVEYFRGGGWSTRFRTPGGMPVTMSRLNLVKGLGPVLQIAEGWTIELPEEVQNTLDQRTNPSWPTTWFVPNLTGQGAFTDVYNVMYNWGANHGAISFGHIGADLISLAALLRIPVFMHNVAAERIFRPSAWNAFGTTDREGADFRACTNFGPLYGKY